MKGGSLRGAAFFRVPASIIAKSIIGNLRLAIGEWWNRKSAIANRQSSDRGIGNREIEKSEGREWSSEPARLAGRDCSIDFRFPDFRLSDFRFPDLRFHHSPIPDRRLKIVDSRLPIHRRRAISNRGRRWRFSLPSRTGHRASGSACRRRSHVSGRLRRRRRVTAASPWPRSAAGADTASDTRGRG